MTLEELIAYLEHELLQSENGNVGMVSVKMPAELPGGVVPRGWHQTIRRHFLPKVILFEDALRMIYIHTSPRNQ